MVLFLFIENNGAYAIGKSVLLIIYFFKDLFCQGFNDFLTKTKPIGNSSTQIKFIFVNLAINHH